MPELLNCERVSLVVFEQAFGVRAVGEVERARKARGGADERERLLRCHARAEAGDADRVGAADAGGAGNRQLVGAATAQVEIERCAFDRQLGAGETALLLKIKCAGAAVSHVEGRSGGKGQCGTITAGAGAAGRNRAGAGLGVEHRAGGNANCGVAQRAAGSDDQNARVHARRSGVGACAGEGQRIITILRDGARSADYSSVGLGVDFGKDKRTVVGDVAGNRAIAG